MVCELSRVTLVTTTRCWLLAGRITWSQITFSVRLNLLTNLPSQVRSLQMRIKKFHFTLVLFDIKSQIGWSRHEFVMLN